MQIKSKKLFFLTFINYMQFSTHNTGKPVDVANKKKTNTNDNNKIYAAKNIIFALSKTDKPLNLDDVSKLLLEIFIKYNESTTDLLIHSLLAHVPEEEKASAKEMISNMSASTKKNMVDVNTEVVNKLIKDALANQEQLFVIYLCLLLQDLYIKNNPKIKKLFNEIAEKYVHYIFKISSLMIEILQEQGDEASVKKKSAELQDMTEKFSKELNSEIETRLLPSLLVVLNEIYSESDQIKYFYVTLDGKNIYLKEMLSELSNKIKNKDFKSLFRSALEMFLYIKSSEKIKK